MSGDDELEGSDDVSLWEHFAPVGRSLKRTVTSRSVQTYAVSFVGLVVLSASLGGVILGPYAAIQPTYGLCDRPTLDVYPASDTEELTAGANAPEFVEFRYDELTQSEQRTFLDALESPNEDGELDGRTAHFEAFRNGSVVTYEGERHYTVVESLDDCVNPGAFNVPLSVLGLVVGLGLSVGPALLRRFRTP